MVFNIKQAIRVAGAVHNLTNAELSGAAATFLYEERSVKPKHKNPI